MEQKIVFVTTRFTDDPERATLPFVLANGCLAMDVKPVIILQADAVWIGVKGKAEEIHASGLDPLKKLLDNVLAEGHRVLACSPCIKERNIKEEDLLPGVYIAGAAKVIEELTSCNASLTY